MTVTVIFVPRTSSGGCMESVIDAPPYHDFCNCMVKDVQPGDERDVVTKIWERAEARRKRSQGKRSAYQAEEEGMEEREERAQFSGEGVFSEVHSRWRSSRREYQLDTVGSLAGRRCRRPSRFGIGLNVSSITLVWVLVALYVTWRAFSTRRASMRRRARWWRP